MIEMQITTESVLPKYAFRSKSQGRKPSSIEYEIGTEIYNRFEIGNCSFFSNEIKYKSILSRLDRLNKKNDTEREYSVRKCSELGSIVNSNDENLDKNYEDGILRRTREIIEGFKIYRTK